MFTALLGTCPESEPTSFSQLCIYLCHDNMCATTEFRFICTPNKTHVLVQEWPVWTRSKPTLPLFFIIMLCLFFAFCNIKADDWLIELDMRYWIRTFVDIVTVITQLNCGISAAVCVYSNRVNCMFERSIKWFKCVFTHDVLTLWRQHVFSMVIPGHRKNTDPDKPSGTYL